MAETEKPFVCHKQGLSIKFYARNSSGLKYLGYWIGGYLLAVLLWGATVARHPHSQLILPSLGLLLVLTAVWVVWMYRWLLVRSDVIDLNDVRPDQPILADRDDGMWFAPKRFGIGSGRPIAWQGWALLIVHLAAIGVGPLVLQHHPAAKVTWIALFAVLPLPLYAARTRGGWKWRWGE